MSPVEDIKVRVTADTKAITDAFGDLLRTERAKRKWAQHCLRLIGLASLFGAVAQHSGVIPAAMATGFWFITLTGGGNVA